MSYHLWVKHHDDPDENPYDKFVYVTVPGGTFSDGRVEGPVAAYSAQVNNTLETLNKTMTQLRDSMRGIQIRSAGFKRLHDEFARDVAKVSVHAAEFLPAMMPK